MRGQQLMSWSMLVAAACTDLPADWRGARPVVELVQRECSGSPYEGTHDERIEATGDDLTTLRARELHFRCEQDVAAFQLADGDGLKVLVQPKNMNPKAVAACDCLYDVDLTLDAEVAPGRVSLWRRWDNLNDNNDPVFIGALPGDGGADTDDTDAG